MKVNIPGEDGTGKMFGACAAAMWVPEGLDPQTYNAVRNDFLSVTPHTPVQETGRVLG